MEDRIYLLVKCTIKTKHKTIHDAIQELQSKTDIKISSTQNVEVIKIEVMKFKF